MCHLAEQERQGGLVAIYECILSRLMLWMVTTSDSGDTFLEAFTGTRIACYRQLISLFESSVQLFGLLLIQLITPCIKGENSALRRGSFLLEQRSNTPELCLTLRYGLKYAGTQRGAQIVEVSQFALPYHQYCHQLYVRI